MGSKNNDTDSRIISDRSIHPTLGRRLSGADSWTVSRVTGSSLITGVVGSVFDLDERNSRGFQVDKKQCCAGSNAIL